MTDEILLEQLRQVLATMKMVGDILKVVSSVPEEDVYFAISSQVTREAFTVMIDSMIKRGDVARDGNNLRWTGKR